MVWSHKKQHMKLYFSWTEVSMHTYKHKHSLNKHSTDRKNIILMDLVSGWEITIGLLEAP